LARFLLISLLLLLLLMAAFTFAGESLGMNPDMSALSQYGIARAGEMPAKMMLGDWLLESLGLIALFLLIQGRSGAWWLDGLVSGWIAWIFRGPVLVVTLNLWTRLPRDPWWPLALRWLALYSIAGLVLAIIARRQGLER